jgi:hypothetical protein
MFFDILINRRALSIVNTFMTLLLTLAIVIIYKDEGGSVSQDDNLKKEKEFKI